MDPPPLPRRRIRTRGENDPVRTGTDRRQGTIDIQGHQRSARLHNHACLDRQRHTRIHSHCPRHHIGAIRQRPSRVARNRARDVRRPCTQRRAGHDHDTGQKQKQEPGSQPLAQVTPQHTYLRTHRIVPADRTVKPTGASSTADARASNVKSATRRAQQTPREPAQTARNPMKNNLPLAVPKPRHTASPQSQDHDSPTTNQESSMVRYRHPPIEGYPSDAPRSRATRCC